MTVYTTTRFRFGTLVADRALQGESATRVRRGLELSVSHLYNGAVGESFI